MSIQIVETKISMQELQKLAAERFGDMVKAVLDIERRVMAIDGGLHADEEAMLLEQGSKQENLWGVNLYPGVEGEGFVEFDSMINLRPAQGNRSRGVEDPKIREQIIEIVRGLVQ